MSKNLNKYKVMGLIPVTFFILVITSCGVNEKSKVIIGPSEIVFNLIDSTKINYNQAHSVSSFDIQWYHRNGESYAMLASMFNHSLLEFNISDRRVENLFYVEALMDDKYPAFNFHYTDYNSVLIRQDPGNKRGRNNDSTIFFCDFNGAVLEYLKTSHTPLYSGRADKDKDWEWRHGFSSMEVEDSKIYFSPTPASLQKSEWLDSIKELNEVPWIAFYDFDTGNAKELPLEYPKWSNENYNNNQKTFYMHASQGFLTVGRANDNDLYLINTSTKEMQVIKANPSLISDPVPDKTGSQSPNSTLYKNVFYDDRNDNILRWAVSKQPNELPDSRLWKWRNERRWVGLFQADSGLVAEGLLPDWLSMGLSFGRIDDVLVSIKADKEGELVFYFFDYHIESMNQTRRKLLKDSIEGNEVEKAETFDNYIANYNIPKGSYAFIVPESSCPTCSLSSVHFYIENQELLEENNVYLIVVGKNFAKEVMQSSSKFIIRDEEKQIEDYLNIPVSNPAIVEWDGEKINKVLFLRPSEVRNLRQVSFEFMGM